MGTCISVEVPADTIVTDCKNAVVEQLTYKAKLKDDLHKLNTETEKLSERKRDVEREVAVAEKQPSMKRLHTVEGWLERVAAAETGVGQLKTRGAQQVANLCLGGLCSKNLFKSSYRFGVEVTKMLERVADLKEEGDQFGSVAAETIQDDLVRERPCETARMGSESTFDEAWKFLEEEQVRVFGLYGLAGVGKTTLLNKINNKLGKACGDFDVIWISVDGRLQLGEIQEMIAKKINVFDESWMSKSFEEKVSSIYNVLSRRKFVLLLDDVWERVDLVKAGVPHPTTENKSKVVFTTRLVEVCGQMEADKQFKVECLAEEEAWELFKSIVGDGTLDRHHEIPGLAKTVAKECGGLHLALVHTARGMARKRTPQEWEHAIAVLRGSAYKFPGMEEKVFGVLKSSYDHLSSDAIRSCFEYCSLFPKGHRISKRELIDYWISEGLLDDKNGLQLQNDGYQKIGVLVNACLLEEVDNDCVKMHNVIRNMALWITTKLKETEEETGNFYVQAGNQLTAMPNIGELRKVKKISVMDNQIQIVMEIASCPDLITLFLNGNPLKEIAGGFLQAMPNLKVLNLSNNPNLTVLPPEIARLVSLQHLDVSKTSIKELPVELKSLLQIKCLNLEHTSQLQTIQQQLISGFPNLQVLRMLECGSSTTRPGEDNVPYSDAKFLEELLSLKCLVALTISLKSFDAFDVFSRWEKLQRCTRSLRLQDLPRHKYVKATSAYYKDLDTLHVSDCKHLEGFKIDCSSGIQSAREPCGFRSLRTVIISSCFKLRDLTWLILATELKILVVSSCLHMRKIIDVDKLCDIPESMRSTIRFSKLESLELQHLENLHSIYTTTLPFRHLKKIKVIGCPELKTLPLDSNNAQGGRIVIECERQWWGGLMGEKEATQSAFSPRFIDS